MIITSGTIVYDEKGLNFEVMEFIGSGSFGNVYKIRRKKKGDVFALKTIQTPFTDSITLKSFMNEGKTATKIVHKNVITYYYFHDGSKYNDLPPYIIMEYANDGTLSKVLKDKHQQNDFFQNTQLTEYFAQLIGGMEAINKELVHRDIKPDNILISNDIFKISDFGLSKIVTESTRKSTFKGIGCLPYLAPEAWQFEKNTIQMDIYSMGIVFYELATLKHPLSVSQHDLKSWENAHLFQKIDKPDLVNSDISPVLSQLIMKMIEKSVKSRYNNWNDVKEMLKKENLPSTTDSQLVETVLKKRIEIDAKATEERLNQEKRNQEISTFNKLIQYQLYSDIVNPIKIFLSEVNLKYEGNKNHIDPPGDSFKYTIVTSSGNKLNIEISSILKEDFYREVKSNDFGRIVVQIKLTLPKFENKLILAWGYIKANDGRGMNLILVENKDEVYGTWYLLSNSMSSLVRQERPKPFPFEFDEIEREIELILIRALHIYNTQHEKLNIESLKEFIAEYI